MGTSQPTDDGDAREMGFVDYTLPDSFAEPLPDDELAGWDSALRYTPPTPTPPPWPKQTSGPKYTDAEVEALLHEQRGDC